MISKAMTRRAMLQGAGAAAAVAMPGVLMAQKVATHLPYPTPDEGSTPEQAKRMQWWHEARFGMFIHWGLYSVHARHEWAMEEEAIPVTEYQQMATEFRPVPNAAKAWARLAKAAGMKYMVMTTKHHEGFCHWDTKLTNYNAMQQGPKRDLVREYVEAARAEGMRVGFYYSLMDWHHPDGATCKTDEAAQKRFVEYTHGLIRELLTNYGKIDVLWYDVDWPLTPEQWESERMNRMVFELQPEIIVNNRNGLPGDFSTPEQHIEVSKAGRAWESCMTMNDSWGFQRADDAWKTPKTIARNLVQCSRDGGNYLLNIGPKADGTIPRESLEILTEVGRWMDTSGETIYGSDVCHVRRSEYATFTRKGNTLYMHVYFWPASSPATSVGEAQSDLAIAGLTCKVKSARFLRSGVAIAFKQDALRTHLLGLPMDPPDSPMTTIAIECDGEPMQDTDNVRVNRLREKVGI